MVKKGGTPQGGARREKYAHAEFSLEAMTPGGDREKKKRRD